MSFVLMMFNKTSATGTTSVLISVDFPRRLGLDMKNGPLSTAKLQIIEVLSRIFYCYQ